MMNPRGIDMTFDGVPGAEREAARRAMFFAASCGFSEEQIEDVNTAVEEACRNAIEHTLPGSTVQVVRMVCSFVERVLIIDIQSAGNPFVVPERKPDLRAKIEGREPPRGWGLYLIGTLADRVEFDQKSGTVSVKMSFAIKPVRKTSMRS